MSVSTTSRFVYICESVLKTYRDNFPPPKMTELLDDVYSKFQNNSLQIQTTKVKGRGESIYRLRDIKKIDENTYSLLISVSSDDFPDNVNENKLNGDLRYVKRRNGEAPSYSAHLLIRTQEDVEGSSTYSTIVENVKGLPISTLFKFYDIF